MLTDNPIGRLTTEMNSAGIRTYQELDALLATNTLLTSQTDSLLLNSARDFQLLHAIEQNTESINMHATGILRACAEVSTMGEFIEANATFASLTKDNSTVIKDEITDTSKQIKKVVELMEAQEKESKVQNDDAFKQQTQILDAIRSMASPEAPANHASSSSVPESQAPTHVSIDLDQQKLFSELQDVQSNIRRAYQIISGTVFCALIILILYLQFRSKHYTLDQNSTISHSSILGGTTKVADVTGGNVVKPVSREARNTARRHKATIPNEKAHTTSDSGDILKKFRRWMTVADADDEQV